MKNKLTFNKILILMSIMLSFICIICWAKLDEFITEFEMSLNANEENVIITEKNQIDGEIIVEQPLSDGDEIEKFMTLTQEVAQNYAKFTSDDLDFRDIQGYFKENSEILELLETYNSNRYNSHEKSYFENIFVEQPVITSEGLVKCEIVFDYIVETNENTHNYPSSYTLYFDSDDDKVISLEMN